MSTTKVGAGPVNLHVVGGDVWVPNDQDDTLWRLDGATGAVRETIATGPNPAVVAGAAGDVWVSIFEGGQVWRIHPG
jgi:streptogramin lyase